jgi:nickel/cobalt transporter (NicO) family protein
MRLIAAGCLVLALGALVLLHQAGALDQLAWWASEQQRALQTRLAAQVTALRDGTPGALAALMTACAAYGFVHAAGPGHGKVLIGGAALGTRATARRMALIAVLGSLAQALVAIAIVYGGFALFEATARGTVSAAEDWIDPIGNALIAGIGLWLIWRGLRRIGPATRSAGAGTHDHDAARCGHDHGPDAAEVARARGLADTLALIGGMAARPCTGALFVLVIAWRMDLASAGAAAVLAMGLGTATVTLGVAVLAVTGREAALISAGDGRAARILMPALQIAGGGLILAVSALLLVGGR